MFMHAVALNYKMNFEIYILQTSKTAVITGLQHQNMLINSVSDYNLSLLHINLAISSEHYATSLKFIRI